MTLADDLFEEEQLDESDGEESKETFIIDMPNKANWAVCRIKEARQRRDLFNEAAESKIEELQDKIEKNNVKYDNETAFLMSTLSEYMKVLPTKKSKTQETFVLPDGNLKRKFARSVLKPDKKGLIEYLEEEKEYIKITKEVKWAEFKKLLKEQDGQVIRNDTGEIIDCITIEEKPATFEVE